MIVGEQIEAMAREQRVLMEADRAGFEGDRHDYKQGDIFSVLEHISLFILVNGGSRLTTFVGSLARRQVPNATVNARPLFRHCSEGLRRGVRPDRKALAKGDCTYVRAGVRAMSPRIGQYFGQHDPLAAGWAISL